MKFRNLVSIPILSTVLTMPAYADSFWTGEVDGTFSSGLNWQSGLAPELVNESLYYAGDNLVGNSVTAINYDLTGATYNRLAFNYLTPIQQSTQIANYSLTGSLLNFSGPNSVLSSAAGTNNIANNIQADNLHVYSGSSSNLTLDGSITLTGGDNETTNWGYNSVYYLTRHPNLSFQADDGGSLVINGDINDTPLSDTRGPLDWRNRFISFDGAGVEFNGNLDVYTGYSNSSVEMIDSTINGSVASQEIWSNSAIINGVVQTADFMATGNTIVTGAINLDDHTVYTFADTSDPASVDLYNNSNYGSKVSVLADRTDGSDGALVLAGGGVITSSNLESAATHAPLNVYAPRIELHDGRLTLDNSGQAVVDRVADNIDVHFGTGGVLALEGHATTAVNEQLGQLVVGADHIQRTGGSNVSYNNTAAYGGADIELSQNSSLTTDAISISQGRWLNVSTTSGNLGGGAASDPALLISSTPVLVNGLVDGVLLNGKEFATYDAVNGVVSATSADNIRYDAATSLPVTGAPQVMNSLALNFDGQLGGSDSIALTSGRLLANGNVNIAPSVDFGAQQGRIYAFGDVDFAGGAVANNGLQVSGDQEFDSVYNNTTVNTRTVTFSGGVALNGPLGIDSATVQIDATQSSNLAGGLLNNSVLNNAGSIANTAQLKSEGLNRINNSGLLNNNGGDLSGSGYISDLIIDNSGTVTNQAAANMRGDLKNNGGSFVNDNAEFTGYVDNRNGGVFTNQNGGTVSASIFNSNATITNEAGSTWTGWGGTQNRNGGSIVNRGEMVFNASFYPDGYTEAHFNVDSTSSLHNTGTITLNGGDLVIANGAGFTAGSLVLKEECQITYSGGGGENCFGGNLIVQQANYSFGGSLVGNTSVYENAGYIRGNVSLTRNRGEVRGETSFYGDNRINSGTLDGVINAGAITNSGNMSGEITAYDVTNNSSGSIYAGSSSYAPTGASSLGAVVNYGSIGAGSRGMSISSLDNYGTVNNSGSMGIASLDNKTSGKINNSGNMSFNNASDVSTGTITNSTSGNLNFNERFTSTGAIDNAGGTLTVNDVLRNDGSIINTGTLNVAETGRINGVGTYTQDAGETIVNGTIVGDVNVNGGLLSGSGRITGDVVVNGGGVGPGNSPGSLFIDGDFVLTENGTLHLEVDGLFDGEFDKLFVSGLLDLQGDVVFDLGETIDLDLFTTELGLGNFFHSSNPENFWDEDNLDIFAGTSFSAQSFDGTITTLALEDINVSAVPVPAALWLFGSGLIGLIGIARRKA